MTPRLATTASDQVAGRGTQGLVTFLRVRTITPRSIARASADETRARPTAMTTRSGERMKTSSPASTASSIDTNPGASRLAPLSRIEGTAPSAATTNRRDGFMRAAASGRGIGSQRSTPGRYRTCPTTAPPTTISSIRSGSGTLFISASIPSGTRGAPKWSA